MAIFLQIKSHDFIRTSSLNLLFDKFKVYYEESRTDKQIAQDLRFGFEELIKVELIQGFEETKTKSGKKIFKIKKLKNKTNNKINKGE